MTNAEQYDMVMQMRLDGEFDREARIRELAEKAALYPQNNFHAYGYRSGMNAGFASDIAASWTTISVDLEPSLIGFERVLVAEEIVRRQIGDR